MTVIKLVEHNTFKIIIGGLHGHSSEAFSNDLENNLVELSRKAGGMKEFQIIIPVHLYHEKNLAGIFDTYGKLDWGSSEIHKIS